MEVILTVLIMSMLLTGISQVLSSTRITRDSIYNLQETMLAGPAILDLVERDLRGIVTLGIPRENQLRVVNRVLGGNDADSLDFLTTTDGLLWEEAGGRMVRADWNEVGYRLRPNPENDDFFELYRREAFGSDSYTGDAFDQGRYTFLHDRIKSFDIQVFAEDGEDAEPEEEWGSASDAEIQGLPARLEITMVVELAARISREGMPIAAFGRLEQTYRRIVRLPESLRLDARQTPRLAVPAFPSEEEQAGGGAGAGDGGEEGEGGEGQEGGGDDGGLGEPETVTGGADTGGGRGGGGGLDGAPGGG